MEQLKGLHVALLPDEYLPDGTRVHAKMIHELVLELKRRGHFPVIITPGNQSQKKRLEVDFYEGIEVWRFRCPTMRGVGLARRALVEITLSARAWLAVRHKLKERNFDLCINYSPTIFFGGLASILKRKGAFIYLILRDFFPQWLIDQGRISSKSPVAIFFRLIEKFNYKTSDYIALQSPKNESVFRFLNQNYSGETGVLYNWSSTDTKELKDSVELSKLLKSSKGKTLFFYGGNMGFAQDMPNLIRLVKNMADYEDAHFLFIGDGDQHYIVEMAAESLNNLTASKSISQNLFQQILRRVDIGLFSLSAHHSAHNFPGKLLGYMVNEIPILGSINQGNDLKELVESNNAGLIFLNGEDKKLQNAAAKLLEDSRLRKKMGESGLALHKKFFSVDSAAEAILATYSSRSEKH